MKKKIYLLLLLALVGLYVPAKAVLVNIPDANFRARLQTLYPTCFVGAQMETTCGGITSATTLNLNGLGIASLTGLEHFTSLQILGCEQNQLANLPVLPASLQVLRCSDNQLISLPALPASLQELGCRYNQLTSLPALPASLLYLYCNNNQLISLPTLSGSLLSLHCNSNQLTSLPALPVGLISMNCTFNQLTSLPTLPASLSPIFDCSNNQLTSLPQLPLSLQKLYCNNNQLTITGLSGGFPANLLELYCNNNQLTILPALPISLQILECSNNQLVILSALPIPTSLQILRCRNNQLISLPALPVSLQYLDCYNNQLDFSDLENINPLPTNYFIGAQRYKILPAIQSVAVGATVTINGIVGGSLNTYQWYKDGVLISGATSAIYTEPNFYFACTYKCVVRSTYASPVMTLVSITSNDVTVTPPPSQTINLPIINIRNYGDIFFLGASASSGLPLTYQSANNLATVSAGGMISIVGVGTVSILVSQAGNASYAPASAIVTFNAYEAPLTMTADNKTRIVGVANPAFTFTYSGFVLGENQNTANMFTQGPTATCVANSGSAVGIYAIVPSAIARNYTISFINGTLTVTNPTLIAQTITLPTISTKTYGDAGFSLGASTTSGLSLTYVSSNTSIAIVSATGIVSIIGAGTTNITASQAGNGSFLPATPVTQVLTILKKDLTVTAQTFSTEACNGTDIYFPLNYSGFVNGETSQNLTTLPVGFVGPTKSTTVLRVNNTFVPTNGTVKLKNPFVVRTYTISVAGGVSNNYNFIYVTGAVTLTECPIWKNTTNPAIITETLDNQITVYPNPSNSDFKIDFGSLEMNKAVIRVYDMQGKQVYTTEITSNINEIKNTTNIAIISLGNMANGIYLLQISTEKGNIQKRIVKAD